MATVLMRPAETLCWRNKVQYWRLFLFFFNCDLYAEASGAY